MWKAQEINLYKTETSVYFLFILFIVIKKGQIQSFSSQDID